MVYRVKRSNFARKKKKKKGRETVDFGDVGPFQVGFLYLGFLGWWWNGLINHLDTKSIFYLSGRSGRLGQSPLDHSNFLIISVGDIHQSTVNNHHHHHHHRHHHHNHKASTPNVAKSFFPRLYFPLNALIIFIFSVGFSVDVGSRLESSSCKGEYGFCCLISVWWGWVGLILEFVEFVEYKGRMGEIIY
jgi:hypothetical protein